MHSIFYSSIHWPIHPSIHQIIHKLVGLFAHSFIHQFIYSSIHFIYLLICSNIHSHNRYPSLSFSTKKNKGGVSETVRAKIAQAIPDCKCLNAFYLSTHVLTEASAWTLSACIELLGCQITGQQFQVPYHSLILLKGCYQV